MVYKNFEDILYVIVVAIFAYIGMVFLLRISGNRTLSKMNSFDLVITIAFGSALSAIIVNRSVNLTEGLTAIAMLVALQFIVTWTSVRSKKFNHLVKAQPTLLVENGKLISAAMKKVRVAEDEIHSTVRQHGLGGLEQVAAVVMETDGSLSVISMQNKGSLDALSGVHRMKKE